MEEMDFEKDFSVVRRHNFSQEFQINKFGEMPDFVPDYIYNTPNSRMAVFISVQGKGRLPENGDGVILRIRNSDYRKDKSERRALISTVIVNILDVEGRMKFPRTFECHFLTKKTKSSFSQSDDSSLYVLDPRYAGEYVERYVERSYILNNASEYLRKDTLTVIIEGTIEEREESRWTLIDWWKPANNIQNFQVEQLENDIRYWYPPFNNINNFGVGNTGNRDLRIYLRRDSVHADSLIENSSVFRDMWGVPMLESKENRVLLENEELPAFLCMLFFLETKQLILYEITVFDLYKIADKYHVQILLDECRECIENILLGMVTSILDFATYYDDKDLRRNIESYLVRNPLDTQGVDPNFGIERNLHNYPGCHTRPVCSHLIRSESEFKLYIINIWNKIKMTSEINSENEDNSDVPPIQILNRETETESFNFYQ